MIRKILFVFGTRPEAIKCAPLIKAFQATGEHEIITCVTGQHREMLSQVLAFFQIDPDYDLELMRDNQSLTELTSRAILEIGKVVDEVDPDLLFVQGDTTTVLAGAIIGYYAKIKVAHLEAGLRSGDKYSPYPEEINRVLTGHVASLHFAPTLGAIDNLRDEGIVDNVWLVGNTSIDALHLGLDILKETGDADCRSHFSFLHDSRRVVLVTAHRRESFGEPMRNICKAIHKIASSNRDVQIVFPVHLNPNVRTPVFEALTGVENVHLVDPLSYKQMIWLMKRCDIVLTDSGGVQEEAPALGKPVLVMREVSERMEGVAAGTAKLVGNKMETIVSETQLLLDDPACYSAMAKAVNPYGDGTTSEQILEILRKIDLG